MTQQATIVDDPDLDRELRAHYLGTVDERLDALHAAVATAHALPGDADAAEGLRHVVHKMAGTAGTYGFRDLSAAAKVLEPRIIEAAKALPLPVALLADAVVFRDFVTSTLRAAKAELER